MRLGQDQSEDPMFTVQSGRSLPIEIAINGCIYHFQPNPKLLRVASIININVYIYTHTETEREREIPACSDDTIFLMVKSTISMSQSSHCFPASQPASSPSRRHAGAGTSQVSCLGPVLWTLVD